MARLSLIGEIVWAGLDRDILAAPHGVYVQAKAVRPRRRTRHTHETGTRSPSSRSIPSAMRW